MLHCARALDVSGGCSEYQVKLLYLVCGTLYVFVVDSALISHSHVFCISNGMSRTVIPYYRTMYYHLLAEYRAQSPFLLYSSKALFIP